VGTPTPTGDYGGLARYNLQTLQAGAKRAVRATYRFF